VLKSTTPQLGGAVAQVGARLDGIEEVVGSNPIGSTILENTANRHQMLLQILHRLIAQKKEIACIQ
jgi:hypothetical protein